MFINFSDIPGHQNLFLDYLYEAENTNEFFPKNFRNEESYGSFFEELTSKNRPHKNELVDIITAQYEGKKFSKATEQNLEALRKSNTAAVVTGQQLGIFGGPLYTFFKTATTIKLAKQLKSEFTNINFVPVFWMEGEDHDFEEIRTINLPAGGNDLQVVEYLDGLDEEKNRGSVGKLVFNENLISTFESLDKLLAPTDFKEEVMTLLKKCYKPGVTAKQAFRDLIFELFDDQGLILFDPTDPQIKELLKPIFEKEIVDFRDHTSKSVLVSAELEEAYHAQVKVKPVNLFYSDETGRYLIEPVEEFFRLKGKRNKFTKEELLGILEENPERFGPNVLLRPICQDYLFPTAFYIGGPSEISYFAQVYPLYSFFDIQEPFVYPRSSATILEKNIQKVLDKYELNIEDIFIEEKLLNKQVINASADLNVGDLFADSQKELELIFDNLKEKLFQIDKTLTDVTEKSQQRIAQTLDVLKNKAEKAQTNNYDVTIRQLNKARSLLYPNNGLQERSLSFIYFANKYGLNAFKWILDELAIGAFEHQIIEI